MISQAIDLNAYTGQQIIEKITNSSGQNLQNENGFVWATSGSASSLNNTQTSVFRIGNKSFTNLKTKDDSLVEAQSSATLSEVAKPSYFSSWDFYLKGLLKKSVFSSRLLDTANGIIGGLKARYGDQLKLPVAFPLESGDFEIRWESGNDSIIIQIDEEQELTLVIRDKAHNKDYGFNCLRLEQFLSIDLDSVSGQKLTSLKK